MPKIPGWERLLNDAPLVHTDEVIRETLAQLEAGTIAKNWE